MKPIHKFNGGKGATLCYECGVIIKEKLTEDLYCYRCKPHKGDWIYINGNLRKIQKVFVYTFEWNNGWGYLSQIKENNNTNSKVKWVLTN